MEYLSPTCPLQSQRFQLQPATGLAAEPGGTDSLYRLQLVPVFPLTAPTSGGCSVVVKCGRCQCEVNNKIHLSLNLSLPSLSWSLWCEDKRSKLLGRGRELQLESSWHSWKITARFWHTNLFKPIFSSSVGLLRRSAKKTLENAADITSPSCISLSSASPVCPWPEWYVHTRLLFLHFTSFIIYIFFFSSLAYPLKEVPGCLTINRSRWYSEKSIL